MAEFSFAAVGSLFSDSLLARLFASSNRCIRESIHVIPYMVSSHIARQDEQKQQPPLNYPILFFHKI